LLELSELQVKDAERKVKRDAKKNPALRKKLKKDLGIPNLNPFKQQILKRLEEQQKLIKFNELASQRRSQEAVCWDIVRLLHGEIVCPPEHTFVTRASGSAPPLPRSAGSETKARW